MRHTPSCVHRQVTRFVFVGFLNFNKSCIFPSPSYYNLASFWMPIKTKQRHPFYTQGQFCFGWGLLLIFKIRGNRYVQRRSQSNLWPHTTENDWQDAVARQPLPPLCCLFVFTTSLASIYTSIKQRDIPVYFRRGVRVSNWCKCQVMNWWHLFFRYHFNLILKQFCIKLSCNTLDERMINIKAMLVINSSFLLPFSYPYLPS